MLSKFRKHLEKASSIVSKWPEWKRNLLGRTQMENGPVRIHIGAGKRDFGPGWHNIDRADFPHIHSHDITKLDFEDNSVDLIYASHVIEYFDQEEIIPILQEWKRVLKTGGILRLAVPNFKAMAELYFSGQYSLKSFIGPMYGKMPCNGIKIYHKMIYDYSSLKTLLETIGFKNIKYWNWRETEHKEFDDQSRAYIPKMDFENGTLISLNIEGEK